MKADYSIKVRWDDDGSVSDHIKTTEVLLGLGEGAGPHPDAKRLCAEKDDRGYMPLHWTLLALLLGGPYPPLGDAGCLGARLSLG